MRRAFVIAVLLWCGVTFWMAMILDLSPEKIIALSSLLGALSVIAMPIVVSYLGIAEAGQVIREIRAPGTTRVSTTFEQVTKDQPVDPPIDLNIPPKPGPGGE